MKKFVGLERRLHKLRGQVNALSSVCRVLKHAVCLYSAETQKPLRYLAHGTWLTPSAFRRLIKREGKPLATVHLPHNNREDLPKASHSVPNEGREDE